MCYVDDLTLIAGDQSFLWGPYPDRLQHVAAQWEIGVRDTLVALGLEWALTNHAKPEYAKDRARVRDVEERLESVTYPRLLESGHSLWPWDVCLLLPTLGPPSQESHSLHWGILSRT